MKWTEEQRNMHRKCLNSPTVKENIRNAQKVAQNRAERKIRQSEIMNEFYSDGGSKIVSEKTSIAQRKAPHWHMPLKLKIYNVWVELGKPKQGAVVKAISNFYKTDSSKLKLLIYEFKDYGFVNPL